MQLKKLIENPSFLDYSLSNLKSPEDADERYSHTYSGSPIKADKYYDSLGKLVDKHPLASGRVRRG